MNNPICVCIDRNPFQTVDELVEQIATVGLAGPEWFEMGPEEIWSNRDVASRLHNLTRRLNLTPQYHAPYTDPFDIAREAGKARSPESLRRLVGRLMDNAERLGCSLITVHLGNQPADMDRPDALSNVLEGLLATVPDLERRRMRLALENHTAAIIEHPLGDRPEEFDWLMEEISSPAVGRTFDPAHAHINGHLDEFLARPFDRVFNIHLHDNHGEKDEHLPIGGGTLPWDRVFARLGDECYRGALTLEYFAPAEAYRQSIERIRSA